MERLGAGCREHSLSARTCDSRNRCSELGLKWAYGFQGSAVAGQPTVVDGRLFVLSSTGRVYSLDAKTGCTYWTFDASAGTTDGHIHRRVRHPKKRGSSDRSSGAAAAERQVVEKIQAAEAEIQSGASRHGEGAERRFPSVTMPARCMRSTRRKACCCGRHKSRDIPQRGSSGRRRCITTVSTSRSPRMNRRPRQRRLTPAVRSAAVWRRWTWPQAVCSGKPT